MKRALIFLAVIGLSVSQLRTQSANDVEGSENYAGKSADLGIAYAVPNNPVMKVLAAPEANYAIVDLGEGFSPRGVNDSGIVASTRLVFINGVPKYPCSIWQNGVTKGAGNDYSLFAGPLQNGTVYCQGPDPDFLLNVITDYPLNKVLYSGPNVTIESLGINARSAFSVNSSQTGAGVNPASLVVAPSVHGVFSGDALNLWTANFEETMNEVRRLTISRHITYASVQTWSGRDIVRVSDGGRAVVQAYRIVNGYAGATNIEVKYDLWGSSTTIGGPTTFDLSFEYAYGRWHPDDYNNELFLYKSVGFLVGNLFVNDGGTVLYNAGDFAFSGGNGGGKINQCKSVMDINSYTGPEGPYILGTYASSAQSSHSYGIWCKNNGNWTNTPIVGIPSYSDRVIGRNISNRLEIPMGDKLWRNSKQRPISELCGNPSNWANFNVYLVSPNNGLLAGSALKTRNEGGALIPVTNQKQHGVLLVPVEVLKPEFTVDGSETGRLKNDTDLKVAQWEHAFNGNSRLKNDFINYDRDRFYIRIPSMGENTENVKVSLSCYDVDGNLMDQGAELAMFPDPATPGFSISKSLILVSDNIDDEYSNNDTGTENSKGDRTYKISLRGTLRISLQIGEALAIFDVDVPDTDKTRLPIKTAFVTALIVRNSVGGEAPVTSQQVEEDFQRIRQRYAQLNVDVVLVNTFTVDPPPFVNLEDGLNSNFEDKGIVDFRGTPAVDDINLFYVKEVLRFGGFSQNGDIRWISIPGVTLIESDLTTEEKKYSYNSFISLTGPLSIGEEAIISAHELGHTLTNSAHYDGVNKEPNIMWEPANVSNSGISQIEQSKRFYDSQKATIRNSPLAH